MSLYALFPGAPLTPQPTCSTGSSSSLYRPPCADLCQGRSLSSSSSSSSPEPKPRVVLDFSKIDMTSASRSKGVSRTNSLSTAETEALSMSTSSTNTPKHDQQLKIQVREVKINFNKLARPNARNSNCTTLCRSKRDARLRRRTRQQDSQAACSDFNSYENAIEFDLKIQFVGRNYSTKRTLTQIAQLRQDLMQEMAFTENLFQQKRWEEAEEDESSWDSSDSSSMDIPSLPRMSEAGVFGGGFAQMSGMMQAYRPALEGWFQTMVAAVSEDSPILADFLWEPLRGEDALHASLAQLGCIQEMI